MNNFLPVYSVLIPLKKRMIISLIAVISTVFLTFYNQLVCPFLESLPFFEEYRNLAVIFILQILFREILFHIVTPRSFEKPVTAGYYKILVFSWIFAGLAATALHEILYINYDPEISYQTVPWVSDYPWHSHLKVLSGFWFLGGGLLSQLELTIGEKYIRQYIEMSGTGSLTFNDKISKRITWGNFFYAFVPSVTLFIMVIRYALQDMIIPLAITAEIGYIAVVFIAVALLAALFYGRMLREDTYNIVEAVKKIGKGDFNSNLYPTRQDELGLIASGINKMAEGLLHRERLKESFGFFVNPEIAEKFVAQYSEGKDMRSHGEKKKVAVLMCDIRNFSQISEKMDPSDVASMLNNYFDHMVSAVQRHGGIVDKFIGDAVMAVFGILDDEGNPSVQAVNAALDMRQELKKANIMSLEMGCPSLNNGIGIHYGEVIASYLGSSDRLEFTVIGSTVNTAARLESQAKKPNPPVIISSAVVSEIKNHFGVEEIGEADLKGIGRQKLYTVKTRKMRKEPG
jgi:adenylate cyclase